MEYAEMLKSPEILEGFLELVGDSDVHVVKRTIRVFTNVYKYSLLLLAEGKLDAELYASNYKHLSAIGERVTEMLMTSDNEGVTLHLVQCLETIIMTNITSDVTKYPTVVQLIAPVFKRIYDALMAFVSTPYVGGTTFCLAMRALFTVAVRRENLRPVIIQFSESILQSPPPNLFDHNIRSFRKSLQRNFFWLLKVAVEDEDKENLIGLMEKVGIPRRRLKYWAPKIVSKKRSAQAILEESIIFGNQLSSSTKRRKTLPEEVKKPSIPSGHMSTLLAKYKDRPRVPTISATAMLDKILSMGESPEDSVISKSTTPNDIKKILSTRTKPVVQGSSVLKIPSSSQHEVSSQPIIHTSSQSSDSTSKATSIPSDKLSPVPIFNTRTKPVTKDLSVFENPASPPLSPTSSQSSESASETPIIPLQKLPSVPSHIECPLSNFKNRSSHKEQYLYEKLDEDMVVDIILSNANNIPSEKPDTMPSIPMYNIDLMRENLSILTSMYLKEYEVVDNCLVNADIKRSDVKNSCSESDRRISCSVDEMHMKQSTSTLISETILEPLNHDIDQRNNRNYDISSSSRDPQRQSHGNCIGYNNQPSDPSNFIRDNQARSGIQSKVETDVSVNSSNLHPLIYSRRTDRIPNEIGFQSNSRDDRDKSFPNPQYQNLARDPRRQMNIKREAPKNNYTTSSNRVLLPLPVPQMATSTDHIKSSDFSYRDARVSHKNGYQDQHPNFFSNFNKNNRPYGGFDRH